jgi:hypothetical protein
MTATPTRTRALIHGRGATLLVCALLALLAACSPEATRRRGAGPGADIGNHGSPMEIHGQTNPSYQTPRVGQAIRT